MAAAITRDQMVDAFDTIGAAAVKNGTTLDIAIYDGLALVLSSNFRYSSEDVDINEIGRPWPNWLEQTVQGISKRYGWSDDWLNDAIQFHLSAAATGADHVFLGSFPRGPGVDCGLRVYVPTPEYMLALKLKAFRIGVGGRKSDVADILNLIEVLKLATPSDAIDILRRYFPQSAKNSEKQLFLLKQLWNQDRHHAPKYPD